MAEVDRFSEPPPIRVELTGEQVVDLERAKPPGAVALVVGYAQRNPWPDPKRFTLCAWFVEMPEAEAALMAAGIMAKRRPKATRPKGRKKTGS